MSNLVQLAVAPLAILFSITLVVATSSPPVEAMDPPPVVENVTGCTLAPGGPGALNCVYLNGSSLYINYSDSIYNSGAVPVNVCDPQGKWRYMLHGTNYYLHTLRSTDTCGWWRGFVTWHPRTHMADGSSFCATQKNSVIPDYANFACETIKR